MNAERSALLAELSRVYRQDPVLASALSVAYDGTGTATVTIADDTLVVSGRDGAESFDITLSDSTLTGLCAAINTHGGYLASLTDASLSPVHATVLAEESDRLFSGTFWRWTNPNWRILEPFRRQLVTKAVDLDVAIDQLNLLKAAAFFADFWGVFTDTTRKAAETDEAYTARQLYELLRPRENNQALAAIIERDFGAAVASIRDLRTEVLILSKMPMRGYYLPGRRYNTASVEVVIEAFPTAALLHAVLTNVAGGVQAFVVGEMGVASLTGGYDVVFGPLFFGVPAAMQIGVGTIGVDKIGPP